MIGSWKISTNGKVVSQANTPNKMDHSKWKSIKKCAWKWRRKLCAFLFEVTWAFGKMWANLAWGSLLQCKTSSEAQTNVSYDRPFSYHWYTTITKISSHHPPLQSVNHFISTLITIMSTQPPQQLWEIIRYPSHIPLYEKWSNFVYLKVTVTVKKVWLYLV